MADVPDLETERVFVPQSEAVVPIVVVSPESVASSSGNHPIWNWQMVLTTVWLLGVVVAFGRLCFRLAKMWTYRRLPADGDVVALPGGSGSFSFAGRIFLDDAGLSSSEIKMVLLHERTHLRKGHFLDNLFLELTAVFWWFHPFIAVMRKNLHAVHEFQADAVAALPDPLQYSQLVLKLARGRIHQPPANAFASSKAGQRIEMLHRKPESKMTKLKYLLLLPLIALLAYSFVLVPSEDETLSGRQSSVENRLEFAGEAIPEGFSHVQPRIEKYHSRLKGNLSLVETLEKRAATWGPKIAPILMEEKVPLDFFFLAMAESNLRLNVMSPGGACGMWQFMPGTARTFGLKVSGEVDQRTDALLATRAACRYLKSAHSELGSWTAAAIAYNRGVPGYRKFLDGRNAKSYFEVNDSGENYLYRVMAFKMLMTQAAMRGEAVDKEPVSNPPKWNPLRTKGFEITSGFGMRYDPVSKTEKMHNGIDLKAPTGTIVQAPANGEVIEVGEDDMHGKFIVLRHDNEYTTRYFHLDEVFVPLGQVFIIGKDIGTVGETGRATGPHLHYEILKNGKQVDPEGYLVQPQGAIDGILDRMKVGDPENVPSGVIQKGDGC